MLNKQCHFSGIGFGIGDPTVKTRVEVVMIYGVINNLISIPVEMY